MVHSIYIFIIYILKNFITRLENLVNEFGDHVRYECRVGIGEERHRSHQRPAVEIDHILVV